jgi:hypothetical protein
VHPLLGALPQNINHFEFFQLKGFQGHTLLLAAVFGFVELVELAVVADENDAGL